MSSEDKYYVIDGILIHSDNLEEFYHAGIKGMKWGKHLPGTDWWKGTTNYYKQHVNRGGSNFQANVYATKEAAKKYGGYVKDNTKTVANAVKNKAENTWNKTKKGTSKLWNTAKGYSSKKIAELKKEAKKEYRNVKKEVHKIMDEYKNSLSVYNKNKKWSSSIGDYNYLKHRTEDAYLKACGAYLNAKINGSFKNTVNSFISMAKFDVIRGINLYLDTMGLDYEVDNFLRKFERKN